MQRLEVIWLANTSMNSVLPAAWGSQLPSLQDLGFTYSGLTGTHMLPCLGMS